MAKRAPKGFSARDLAALDAAKILGVCSGDGHAFTAVWPIVVQARRPRSERLVRAVTDAFAAKYHTPASKEWIRGFRQPKRQATTLEFVRR